MKKIFLSIALLSNMMFTACEDMLDVEQKATSSTANFYKTDADAESALTAMYATYIGETVLLKVSGMHNIMGLTTLPTTCLQPVVTLTTMQISVDLMSSVMIPAMPLSVRFIITSIRQSILPT